MKMHQHEKTTATPMLLTVFAFLKLRGENDKRIGNRTRVSPTTDVPHDDTNENSIWAPMMRAARPHVPA